MTDYKTIRGKKVKFFTSDLGNEQAEGQLFFQDTAKEMKVAVASAAWHSTGPLTYDRGFLASSGTQTASWVAGGFDTDSPANYYQSTEEYNGTGWANGGNLPAGLYGAGAAGTQTAGLIFGGANSSDSKQSATATYNGTSWSVTPNSMNTARDQVAGGGIQSSALVVGGRTSAAMLTNMEEWNGTSWSNLTALSQARGYAQANGPETAFFIASGATGNNGGTPMTSLTEEYDGSSLSSGANVNTARSAGGAAGDSSAGLFFGGWTGASPGLALNCETYDGTSWTETADLATHKRGAGSGAGTSNTAAISAGSYGPPSTTTSEEFNVTANTITAGAWSSGGNLNTSGRSGAAGSGIQTASIIAGGGLGTVLNNTESYNGSSWTNLPTLGTARGYMAGATNAPYTASLAFGGATGPGGPYVNNSEEYNGSSWAEGNNLNQARGYLAGFGTQTAGAAAGGTTPGPRAAEVEEYDGTSWSEVNNMPTGAVAFGGCGTQTTGLIIGDAPMKGATYDGTNWTTIPTMNVGGNYNKVFGTSASAMSCGRNPGQGNVVEEWNGTNWFSQASLATGRFNGGQTGTTTAGLVAGPPTATEEFTAETTSLNLKTITDS